MSVIFCTNDWRRPPDAKYLYIILLWCSILTLVRLDTSNAMIKSIGNERRHQLLLREPKIISNSTDENKVREQEIYLRPSTVRGVETEGNTANGTSDNDVPKRFNESNQVTKNDTTINEKLNSNTLRYYADKFGKIINQTIKTAENIKFLHDSFYKNSLRLGNKTESNTAQTAGTDAFESGTKQSPLLEIIELSKNELVEPVAESDQSHILSLIKTKKSKTTPKSLQTTTENPLVHQTQVDVKENASHTVIENVTPYDNGANFTSEDFKLTTETANYQHSISPQSNVSDPVIKYISQSNKPEVTNIGQSKTFNKNTNMNNGTSISKNIHTEDSKYTSADPEIITLDKTNYTTPGNIQIEIVTKENILSVASTAKIKNNTLDRLNYDTSSKPSINNDIDVGSNEGKNTVNVEGQNSDIANIIIASTTPTIEDVKAVISSKYDPTWRNKSLSAIGIKIANKSGKQTILYSKHAPTNLTVFQERPNVINNQFKIPSLRERLGKLSKKRYRLRKVTTNHDVSSTTETTTSSPPTVPPSTTYTTSSSPWILYNGTHHVQDDNVQNSDIKSATDSATRVTTNRNLLQGLSSSHIAFLYDFDRIPTPAPLPNRDRNFYGDDGDVGLPEHVMNNDHQRDYAERMHFDLFHSAPKVNVKRPLKLVCEHKNIELFAEYDDNIGEYSSRNGDVRREKRDAQRVKSLTEFENLIMNLTTLSSNDNDTNEDDSDDFWTDNSEFILPNFTRAMEATTGKTFGPPTEVTAELSELTFEDILYSKLLQNDTGGKVSLQPSPHVNSSEHQKLKSKRKPYVSPSKSKHSKQEPKFPNSLDFNKTDVIDNKNQSSILARHSLTVKRTTIAPGRKKIVHKNIYKLQKPKLIRPEAVEITVESKGHTTQDSQTAQNITTDLAKLMMVLMSKTEDLD